MIASAWLRKEPPGKYPNRFKLAAFAEPITQNAMSNACRTELAFTTSLPHRGLHEWKN